MNCRVACITALTGLSVLALFPVSSSQASPPGWQEQKKEQSNKKENKPASSLTGCVDEEEGRYILVDDQNLAPVANLEAEGFPQEGFAKHLGHKVTVRGTSIPGGARPGFKVRSIEMISETCRPAK